jgi:hypothetical protein
MITQKELIEQAKRLIDNGEDCTVLFSQLETESQLRIKHYTLSLPEELARKTIYGRVAWNNRVDTPRGRGRPRKY